MAVSNPDCDDTRREAHEEQCRRRQLECQLAEHERRVRDEGTDYWKRDMEDEDEQ